MDYFYELYASYILKRTIELTEDDILSINTEERYVPFARLLAQKLRMGRKNFFGVGFSGVFRGVFFLRFLSASLKAHFLKN